jgi:hypothetical protein
VEWGDSWWTGCIAQKITLSHGLVGGSLLNQKMFINLMLVISVGLYNIRMSRVPSYNQQIFY